MICYLILSIQLLSYIPQTKMKTTNLKTSKVFDNKSFDRKMNGRKIQMNDLDLKSFTQPLTLVDFNHHDDVLANPIVSPNSHQVVQNSKNASFIENKGMKNRFKVINSDDLHLTENKQSISDPHANQYADSSKEQSIGSKGNEKERNIPPSEDEAPQKETQKVYKGKFKEKAMPIALERLKSHEDNKMYNKSAHDNRFLIKEDLENIRGNTNEKSARIKPVNFDDHIFNHQTQTQTKDTRFFTNDDSPISPVIPYFNLPKPAGREGGAVINLKEMDMINPQINDNLEESFKQVEGRQNFIKDRNVEKLNMQNSSKKKNNKASTHTYQSYYNILEMNANKRNKENNLMEERFYPSNAFIQQSTNKLENYYDQSENKTNEPKFIPVEDEMSLKTDEDIQKPRDGAVTQGFLYNKINKRLEQNIQKGSSEKKQSDKFSKGMSPQIQNPSTVPQIGSGYYQGRNDNPNRFNQNDYVRPFEMQNEYASNRQEHDMNQQMTLPRREINNQAVYGYNQQIDYRGNEHMRMMTEMMNSMMMFQQNNLKFLMDSHTHLMSKLIAKTCKKRRRHYREESSSSDE